MLGGMTSTNIVTAVVEGILESAPLRSCIGRVVIPRKMGQISCQISRECVKQSGADLSCWGQERNNIREEKDHKRVVKDNMITYQIELEEKISMIEDSSQILPQATLKPHKTQTTFDFMMSSLKASKKPSKIHPTNPFIKLSIKNDEEDLRNTQIDNFIRQKEKKRERVDLRQEKLNKMKRSLIAHLGKGASYKFTFGTEGELLLSHANQLKPTPYFLQSSQRNIKVVPESAKDKVNLYNSLSEREEPTTIRLKKNVSIESTQPSKVLKKSKSSKSSKSQMKSRLTLITQSSEIQKSDSTMLERRNRVFTNNEQRQVSHLPFFQASTGVGLKEIGSVTRRVESEKKVVKKTRSEHLFGFRSYLDKKGKELRYNVQEKHQKKMDYNQSLSSPKMKEREVVEVKTARTKISDRIKTQNQSLMNTLLEI